MLYQFTFVAIIIACLGLYGLASFTADQKTKEIGIRKVLGATGQSIIQLVMKEYVLLIIVANLIAWPVTWYFMNNWLSGFVYRTDIAMGNFLLATAITTAIALVTVSKEIITIVRANPVMALRYE